MSFLKISNQMQMTRCEGEINYKGWSNFLKSWREIRGWGEKKKMTGGTKPNAYYRHMSLHYIGVPRAFKHHLGRQCLVAGRPSRATRTIRGPSHMPTCFFNYI